MKNTITLAQARRVLEVVDAGLSSGLGRPKPGEMCVEAAVCFALGQPHGDEPECVDPVVRQFKIALNDKQWSSKAARAAGMRKIAIAQLGTRDKIDAKAFATKVAELTIRRIVPIALRAAASVKGNGDHKDALERAAQRCEKEGTQSASRAAANACASRSHPGQSARADYAARYAARYAADYAADTSVAGSHTGAAHAAGHAADAAADADAAKARDRILGICAEIGVEALRFVGADGVVLMDKLIK